MAEKQVHGVSEDLPANRPSNAEPLNRTEELIAAAPDPAKSGGKIYRVQYPTSRFVMEGQPVVDTAGVRLTAEQAKAILPLAEASGVKIVEVGD